MSVDQIIDKLKLKIDEGAFTEEEKLALTESSKTVSRYTRLGMMSGTILGLGIAFRRRYAPIHAGFLSATLGIFGLSTGAIIGGVQGIKIINELPEGNNVKRVFLEIRNEMMKEKMENPRGLPILKPPPQQFPNDRQIPNQVHQNRDYLSSNTQSSNETFEEENKESGPKQSITTSWEQIRNQGNSNMSAWDRVRKDSRQTAAQSPASTDDSSFFPDPKKEIRDFYTPDSETNHSSKPRKTNQYGDPID